MRVNRESNFTGLRYMSPRGQDSRRSAAPTEPKIKDVAPSATENQVATEAPSGKNGSGTGKELPHATGADHPTGLERALELNQQNSTKSPEAAGLLHALEMLQRNQEKGGMADIWA
jgi:hypothetical protein